MAKSILSSVAEYLGDISTQPEIFKELRELNKKTFKNFEYFKYNVLENKLNLDLSVLSANRKSEILTKELNDRLSFLELQSLAMKEISFLEIAKLYKLIGSSKRKSIRADWQLNEKHGISQFKRLSEYKGPIKQLKRDEDNNRQPIMRQTTDLISTARTETDQAGGKQQRIR